MTSRRIVFLTGTRADFGKLKPLIAAVASSNEFEYEIFVTGMHMLAKYGSTIREVRRSGFERIYPFVNQDGSVSSQMDLVLATTVQGMGHYLRESRPDLLVIHGDRVEALAGAIAGALNNILVAHIEGGELSGTVDELVRHAVSKLSHLHFVANDEARTRLLQLGEQPHSVHVIGSPDIDVMLSGTLPSLDEVRSRYQLSSDTYGILLYHPVTTELPLLSAHVRAVVDGVMASDLPFVVIYPNNDTGSEIILHEFERLDGNPRFRLLPSMRFEHFLSLLRHARVIAGNSSAGIREAPVYGVPTLNIGTRQRNRFNYQSILNVPEQSLAITQALSNLPTNVAPSTHFGEGKSAERFMEVLRTVPFWATSAQKEFHNLSDSIA